jgi:hypothetical protein
LNAGFRFSRKAIPPSRASSLPPATRWPWTANQHDWRDDEHADVGAPSVCVIPPRVIHTSAPFAPEGNVLVDIFAPPRMDFSDMPGWVLNADEYPKAAS